MNLSPGPSKRDKKQKREKQTTCFGFTIFLAEGWYFTCWYLQVVRAPLRMGFEATALSLLR